MVADVYISIHYSPKLEYMMSLEMYSRKLHYWIVQDRIPVTKGLAVYSVLAYLLSVFGVGSSLITYIAFISQNVLAKPWTLFTYPLASVGGNPLCFVFAIFWLWVAGGSLERSWGTRKYIAFMLLNAGFSALGLLIGGLLSHGNMAAAGLWLPLAGITMAFAALNPDECILFCFVIPMKLKYLAVITAAFVLVNYAGEGFVTAVFALLGCAFSLWYASGRTIPVNLRAHNRAPKVITVYPQENRHSRLNPFRSLKERRDRKRLKDLFERSGMDEK